MRLFADSCFTINSQTLPPALCAQNLSIYRVMAFKVELGPMVGKKYIAMQYLILQKSPRYRDDRVLSSKCRAETVANHFITGNTGGASLVLV